MNDRIENHFLQKKSPKSCFFINMMLIYNIIVLSEGNMHQRHKRILDMLQSGGIRIKSAARELGVTEMTLRRDLRELEAKKQAAIASYDEKIAAAQERIQSLESKKAAILAPKPKTKRKPRKTKKQMIQDIMKQAQKAGLKPQEIAERLGLSLEG